MFGIEERSLLWEEDIAFPEWAWVYRDTTRCFSNFLDRLKQAVQKDGYELDFVMMYGPEIGSPDEPPTGAYGCKTIVMSDAARKASFQRSSGRLKIFDNCTMWQRVPVDKERLERHAREKAHQAMLRMHLRNLCVDETQSALDDGMLKMKCT